MTPTPDTADLGGLVAALVATTIVSLLIAVAVYVWTGLAMSRLFGRLSIEPWRGWVPLLNVAEVLAIGGSPRWIALLFLVPFANIYALVMFAIAAHRVNGLFGRGAGMTVLAVLVLPAWASVLAWGKNTPDPERGRLAEVLGRQTQPTGPLALPPEPVAPRPETARTETPAGERAFPPLPGLEHHVPVRPGAQAAPSTAAPAAAQAPAERPGAFVPPPPSPITPPPGVSAGWPSSPPAGPAVAPASAAVSAPAAHAAFAAPPTGAPVQPHAGVPANPTTGQPHASQPSQPGPAGDRAPGDASVPGIDRPAPQRVDLGAPVAPWAPPADRTDVPDETVREVAPTDAASLRQTQDGAAHPASAPAGAPVNLPAPPASFAPAPPAAPAVAPIDSDQHGLDFADAATIIAYADEEQGDVESTVIVDRRPRRSWRLELDDGEVLPLSGEVVVLGRNPAAADGEQRLPVPDRTRTLSKTHARLAYAEGVWTITDLGSTNGVLIVDAAGEEVLIDPNIATTVNGRFVLGEVGMRVSEVDA